MTADADAAVTPSDVDGGVTVDVAEDGLVPPDPGASDDPAEEATEAPKWVATTLETIKPYGKSVDWLHSKNLIATARPLVDAFFDVLIFSIDDPDTETYLTHDAPGAPQKHNGNPAWHPSGDYIVYTAENEDVEGEDPHAMATPGRGVNCNLWLAKADGTGFWQLTFNETGYGADAMGVLHPQLSPDGDTLLWAERVDAAPGSLWGEWTMHLGRLVIDDAPHLEDIETFSPGEQVRFYETHDFYPDGSRVLFSGNLETGQPETGIDIFEYDPKNEALTPLTSSFEDWDEHAHWSPGDASTIVWMSSTELEIAYPPVMGPLDWRFYLATELWIMNADGSGKTRLTFFNEPGHEHVRAPRTVVSDSTWSPDGKSLLVLLANADGTGPDSSAKGELVLITLAREP